MDTSPSSKMEEPTSPISALQPAPQAPHGTPNVPGIENATPKTAVEHKSAIKETPPAERQRRVMTAALHCSSPSDSMMSPCTSKLYGKKSKISSASAILRSKQQAAIPLNLSQSEESMEVEDDEAGKA